MKERYLIHMGAEAPVLLVEVPAPACDDGEGDRVGGYELTAEEKERMAHPYGMTLKYPKYAAYVPPSKADKFWGPAAAGVTAAKGCHANGDADSWIRFFVCMLLLFMLVTTLQWMAWKRRASAHRGCPHEATAGPS